VPTGCDLSHATVSWNIGESTNNCADSDVTCKASATGYNNFQQNGCDGYNDYNNIGVKSCDVHSGYGNGSSCWGSNSSDCAGTAETQDYNSNCSTSYGNNGQCGGTGTVTSTCTPFTVTATDTKEVQVLASNSVITQDGITPASNLNTLYGGATKLEFTYNPSDAILLKSGSTQAASVTGHNANSMAFVEITDNANPFASGADVYFAGNVQAGQKIFADSTINVFTNTLMPTANNHFDTTAGSKLFAYVFSSKDAFNAGAAALQTMQIGANDASKISHFGDQIGSLSLVGYVGSTGGHLVS